MKNSLHSQLSSFLDKYHNKQQPILLAFSGGPDSLSLLHLLLEYREHQHLDIALAHVDHGWRQESLQEAKYISKMAENLGLICHFKTLEPKVIQGNLESFCREERLKFFSELCSQYGYQATLLAHHADDLAETVLKRMLEGASLPYLYGMQEQMELFGTNIWRPLLGSRKADLVLWLQERGLKGFHDYTNEDPKFLRGKFRTEIVPYLSQQFGKEISQNLSRTAEDSIELKDYLDRRTAPIFSKLQKGPFGFYLDLSIECPTEILELRYSVKKFAELIGLSLSRATLNTVITLVSNRSAHKHISQEYKKIFIDRGRLFAFSKAPIPFPNDKIEICEGKKIQFCGWTLSVEKYTGDLNLETAVERTKSDWRDLWIGRGKVLLPHGQYFLGGPNPKTRVAIHSFAQNVNSFHTILSKWWSDNKVPYFLREYVPVIYDADTLCHEFLTGRTQNNPKIINDGLLVCIEKQES